MTDLLQLKALAVVMLFVGIYGGVCYWMGRRSKKNTITVYNIYEDLKSQKKGYHKILKPITKSK